MISFFSLSEKPVDEMGADTTLLEHRASAASWGNEDN